MLTKSSSPSSSDSPSLPSELPEAPLISLAPPVDVDVTAEIAEEVVDDAAGETIVSLDAAVTLETAPPFPALAWTAAIWSVYV
jgi:hypothetical protein